MSKHDADFKQINDFVVRFQTLTTSAIQQLVNTGSLAKAAEEALRRTLKSRESSFFELHDSVVEQVRTSGQDVVIRINPAIVHYSSDREGAHPVWTQVIDFTFSFGRVTPGPVSGEISDGAFRIAAAVHSNGVSLPMTIEQPVRLDLEFVDSRRMSIEASAVKISIVDEGQFLELFPERD